MQQRLLLWKTVAAGAPSAVLSRNPVNAVVALAAVLGSRTAEILGTSVLIIRGPRAFSLVKVGC